MCRGRVVPTMTMMAKLGRCEGTKKATPGGAALVKFGSPVNLATATQQEQRANATEKSGGRLGNRGELDLSDRHARVGTIDGHDFNGNVLSGNATQRIGVGYGSVGSAERI